MSSNKPPEFNPDGGQAYVDWKRDIEVWNLLGEGKVNKGPAVYLSLQGDARNAVRHISPKELAEKDGVEKILKELDKVYLKDETARTFQAIKEFMDYKREAGCGFPKFFVEFSAKAREMKKYKIEMGDSLTAYFLLKAANLSEDHERLVRATATMKPDDMKDKLQKVFGEFTEGDLQEGGMPVKECLFTKQTQYWKKNRGMHGYHSSGQVGGRNFPWGAQRNNLSNTASGRINSKDEEGNIRRCYECESIKHLSRNCPHKQRREQVKLCSECNHSEKEQEKFTENVKMVNVTLVTESHPQLSNSLGKGVLDSGCTKTVAGEAWVLDYLELLSNDQKQFSLESERQSSSTYRFGDGKETTSLKQMSFPFVICDQEVTLPVDIVKNDIPLLISRPTMTELQLILDTGRHVIISQGKEYPLTFNASGHYEIEVVPGIEVCMVTESLETKETQARKLHRQFAHPSKERLIRLIKQSDDYDKEFEQMIEKVSDECSFCLKYKKPKPRPIVSFKKSDEFNGCVSMDLKEIDIGKLWILHLVDEATGYTTACLIKSKRKEVVIEQIFRIWLAYFGSPKKFHSDCGGEFVNEVFKELGETFNIEVSTTPGESPFGNGKVERGNLILYETMQKTLEDVKCSKETALAWAVCAKNCLQSKNGFSPNMLVFGQNIQLPTITEAELPGLNSLENTNKLVREHFTALHSAREKFIKAEASERIKRALRHQVRTYSEIVFAPGDKVYYKRRKDKRWNGPGKVLGKEGNFVLIRHGGSYYRCHPCHLLKVDREQETKEHKPKSIYQHKIDKTSNKNRKQVIQEYTEEYSSDEEEMDQNKEDSDTDMDETHNVEEPQQNVEQDEEEDIDNEKKEKTPAALKRLMSFNKPGEKEEAYKTVHKYKSSDFEKEKLEEAKQYELGKLKQYEVYEQVKDVGQETISCRWIFTPKTNSDIGVRARLVARGFEEVLNNKTESPTCSREALRMAFAVAATMSWNLQAMDITSAFLQGNRIERDVYVRPPKNIQQDGMIWKLKRCLYGLVDAPRAWYERVSEEMAKLGGVKSLFDKCLFLWHNKSSLIGMIITHVDDFEYCGTEEWKSDTIQRLKNIFNVSKDEKENFRFIGVEIRQDITGVKVNQNKYCSDLKEIKIDIKRKIQTGKPLNENEKKDMKIASGKLLWAISQTRPDMAFQGCQVSNAGKTATVQILNDANKAIRKMKKEQFDIVYPPLGNPLDMRIVVYADGSHGALPSGNSQGAAIVFLQGGGKSAPIAWRSKKIERVTKSPMATEVSAVADGADLGHLIGSMTKEIFKLKEIPKIDVRTDSKSLKDHLETDRVIRDPRLRIDTARLRQMRELQEVEMVWVPGTDNLADCLTKKSASSDKLKKALTHGVLPSVYH